MRIFPFPEALHFCQDYNELNASRDRLSQAENTVDAARAAFTPSRHS